MAQPAKAQDRVNDFVIKLANVNGTGSASANTLLMKSIFRMGVPVMGKNYFPSNIQGLPTWYEIRVTKHGYVARSGRVDLMVAMNAETYHKDVREVSPGGFLIYDSTWPRATVLQPRGHRHPRRAVREDLQRELRRRAQPHPDEEHHVRGRARGAARDRRRGDPPAAHRELLEEARAGGRQHEGGAARLRLREGAPALPAAAAHRAHERDRGPRDDRRQHRGRPRRGVRGRDRRPVVPDHAVHVADGRVQELLLEAARRSRDRQGQLRGDPGRGRALGDRHGARRQLERRARVHRHQRPGHLADERVHRPRLLRRDPGGDLRRPARGPLDRHADAHAAVRHHALRLRLARRHEARAAVPVEPGRVLLHDGAGVRPRRAPADPGVRDVGPRHRHERLDVPRAQVGRQLSARPRQGADARRRSRRCRSSTATSTRTTTASRTGRSRA